MTATIRTLSPNEFQQRCPELVNIYLTAMDYHPKVRDIRQAAWRQAALYPEFHAVCAVEDDVVVGVAYGHLGQVQQWWHAQILRGVIQHNPGHAAVLHDYFEIAEVHVLPTHQGRGIGRQLLKALLNAVPSTHVVLSTPEVEGENNRAFSLYRSFGFQDLLRFFLFRGDPRPFAVLFLAL